LRKNIKSQSLTRCDETMSSFPVVWETAVVGRWGATYRHYCVLLWYWITSLSYRIYKNNMILHVFLFLFLIISTYWSSLFSFMYFSLFFIFYFQSFFLFIYNLHILKKPALCTKDCEFNYNLFPSSLFSYNVEV